MKGSDRNFKATFNIATFEPRQLCFLIQNLFFFWVQFGHWVSRPTPLSREIHFLSGFRKRKFVFQVTKYKTFQKIVQTFPETWSSGSPSVFHFRNRQRFQVPGFEWVHELLLFCLASNPAQFCAEISCGKTGLGHNCTDSRFRMKNDFSVCRRGALGLFLRKFRERMTPVRALCLRRSLGGQRSAKKCVDWIWVVWISDFR